MAQYGSRTSIYIQKNLSDKIDEYISDKRDIYSSRSHFINAAIMEKLMKEGAEPLEEEQEW